MCQPNNLENEFPKNFKHRQTGEVFHIKEICEIYSRLYEENIVAKYIHKKAYY